MWSPVLEGEMAARVGAALQAITCDLSAFSADGSGLEARFPFSLAFGSSGVSLFYYYLWLKERQREFLERSQRFLSESIDSLSRHPMPADLYRGFSGIGWAYEHMRRDLWPNGNEEDSCIELDDALLRWCAKENAPAELLSGC